MKINNQIPEESEQLPQKLGVARRVAKNSFFLLGSTSLGIVTRLAIFPIIARYLGLKSFGIFTLILAISMSISLIANYGAERILSREMATSQKDPDTLFSTSVVMELILALILVISSIILIQLFSPWEHQINVALMLAICEQILFCIGQMYLAVIRGFERMEFDTLANFFHKISLFGLILTAVLLDCGITGIFWARFASSILFLIISIFLTYYLFLTPRLNFNLAYAKYILIESFPVMLFSLLLGLIFKVDVFLLGWMGTAEVIALFEGPHRLLTLTQILATTISFSILPVLSKAFAEQRTDLLQTYYDTAYKFLLILGIFGSLLIYITGKPLIILLLGPEFADAVLSMQIMSPIVVFLFLILLQTSFLLSVGEQRLNTLAVATALLVNIVLDLILIPKYSYIGASFATLISYFIFMVMSGVFINKQGIEYRHGKTVLKLILICLPMYLIKFIELPGEPLTLLVRCAIGSGAYLLLMVVFKVFSPVELKSIKEIIILRKRKLQVINAVSDQELAHDEQTESTMRGRNAGEI